MSDKEKDVKKDALLNDAIKQIEKQYGKGSIMKLGDRANVEVDAINSGSIALDHCLGIGGYPKGRIVEIYGPESSGKTTLALHAIAECQKAGGRAAAPFFTGHPCAGPPLFLTGRLPYQD